MENVKIDWMLGMTQNMMNIVEKNINNPMMNEMYAMISAMMGNLNHMKISPIMISEQMLSMMETMMRNMEKIMINMDMNDNTQKEIMKSMMMYMIQMQMMALLGMNLK